VPGEPTARTGGGNTTDSGRPDGQNDDMETRDWIRDGLRAIGRSVIAVGLAVTNIPLFVLFLVSLILCWVPGVLAGMTVVVRGRADLERRLAAAERAPIGRPYRPAPERAHPFGPRRIRWILGDPATWRDFSWLLPGALIGLALGILGLAVPLYGVEGITLVPLWIWLAADGYGYGIVWPIETFGQALLSMPQGLLILLLGVAAAPWLRLVDARFDRMFLAPTKAAELRSRVSRLTVTRADAVDAQAAELRRIERDLHDGAQARLVSMGMALGLAEQMLDRDPDAARRLLAEAREASGVALVELRHLVRGIHPPVLAERGLEGAVRALALSLPIPTAVDGTVGGRLDTPVESAAYFAVAEALANVTRHSHATNAWVSARHAGGVLFLMVGDDGTGGADPSAGTGLRGIERRLAAFDGTMTLSSPLGGPTVVTMEVPCELSSPRTTLSSGTD
jgi:signal transduction histidine kinase